MGNAPELIMTIRGQLKEVDSQAIVGKNRRSGAQQNKDWCPSVMIQMGESLPSDLSTGCRPTSAFRTLSFRRLGWLTNGVFALFRKTQTRIKKSTTSMTNHTTKTPNIKRRAKHTSAIPRQCRRTRFVACHSKCDYAVIQHHRQHVHVDAALWLQAHRHHGLALRNDGPSSQMTWAWTSCSTACCLLMRNVSHAKLSWIVDWTPCTERFEPILLSRRLL